jgi:hypothetical protein
MIGGKEVAAYGADAEAGFRLPFGNNIAISGSMAAATGTTPTSSTRR